MVAWTDSSSFEVLLDVADANGNSLFWKQLHPVGDGNPNFAIGHGRVLMVVTTRTGHSGQTHLAVHRFDLEGNELGEPVILDPMTYDINGRIVVGDFDTPFIIPTADGWLLLASSRASGRYVAHLAPDGSLVSGLEIMDTDMYFTYGFDDAIPYGSGAVISAQFSGVVLFLSADGIVNQEWHPNQDEHIPGDLVEHQGRIFLTYTTGPKSKDPLTNQVLIRELQCVP
jgi:hypothetical protein